jgi:LysR family hydrogen peroxide-inducible transcriptional activator
VVLAPAAHAVASRNGVRPADLGGQTVLLLEEGHCLRDQALEVCSRADVSERDDFRATSIETLRQMVAAGAGITLLPELASRGAYAQARGVVTRPFTRPAPSRSVGAVWRRSSARSAAITALLDIIVAEVRF